MDDGRARRVGRAEVEDRLEDLVLDLDERERLLGDGLIAGFPLGRYYPELSDSLLVCATELNRVEEIDRLAAALGGKR